MALERISPAFRCGPLNRAIRQSAEFLLECNPSLADYPSVYGERSRGNWFDVEKAGQPGTWVTLRALRLLKATRR